MKSIRKSRLRQPPRSLMWRLEPAVTALGRLTEADCRGSEGSLGHKRRPCPKEKKRSREPPQCGSYENFLRMKKPSVFKIHHSQRARTQSAKPPDSFAFPQNLLLKICRIIFLPSEKENPPLRSHKESIQW